MSSQRRRPGEGGMAASPALQENRILDGAGVGCSLIKAAR